MARWEGLGDAGAWWERLPVGALALVIVAIGVYPAFLIDIVSSAAGPIAGRLG